MTERNFHEEEVQVHGKHINNVGYRSLKDGGIRCSCQHTIDTPGPQTRGLSERSASRPRSNSTHQPSASPDESSPCSCSSQPVGHSMLRHDQVNSQFPALPISPTNPSRRPRSHSRSRSERDALPMIQNIPPMPSIPPQTGRQQKAAHMSSAIPPGYAEDTIYGQPQLEPQPQSLSSSTRKARQQNVAQALDRLPPHPRLSFTANGPRPETAGHLGASSQPNITHEPFNSPDDGHRRSRSRQPVVPPPGFPGPVVNWRDIPRKQINFPFATVPMPPSPEPHRSSRSRSRSRSAQVVPSPDPDAPPVPFIQPRPGRQQNLAPVPSVIPPGYPEGTIWIVDRGRPRLETPADRIARYGTEFPPVLQAGQNHQHAPHTSSQHPQTQVQPHPIIQPQPSPAPQNPLGFPQIPATAPSVPQKPFLKRMFGGIIGGKET